ncbi:MAG: MBL fold metallo-hydrolase [Candidatus Altiarchaeota archaeon]|nr:MBL fold metallo-hydrolase [Candidatus Altiarchaeota archaeon]
MKTTLVYDNEVYEKGLEAGWGFSCVIDVKNTPRILFDTGGDGKILLRNMEKLGITPESIDEIFISHPHWDHTGGLNDLLRVNKKVKLYVPPSYHPPEAGEVIRVREATQIHENIYSTGELDGIEQSMAVKTGKGIALIVGCSHPRMEHILSAASKFGKIYAIIGGLHGFSEYGLFKDLELICPTHCTQYKSEIKRIYPGKCIDGGVGKIITL